MMDMDLVTEHFKYEEGRHLNNIKIKEIKEFVIQSYAQYGSFHNLKHANKVADVLIDMLKKKKQITEHGSQTFVEILLAATLLHNLFYDGTLPSIFEAREKLTPIADSVELPENGRDAIFQAIEAQLGDDMPVVACRPIPSTPTDLFVWAVWFVEYNNSHSVKR